MKQFVRRSAFLMFISSMPADATNDHCDQRRRAEARGAEGGILEVLRRYLAADRLCDLLPRASGRLPSRAALRRPRPADARKVPRARPGEHGGQHCGPARSPTSSFTARSSIGPIRPRTRATARTTCCRSSRTLMERGWPESTLLITVVRDENNEGHAVLTVRTDKGDLRSRQQAPRHHALRRHALHLHQAAVRA